jgi:multiple sugar transport system permease protein
MQQDVTSRMTPATQAVRTGETGWLARRQRSQLISSLASHLLLLAGSVAMMVPFVWMLTSALKGRAQVYVFPPIWLPNPIVWQNLVDVFRVRPFALYVLNTLTITTSATIGTVLSASMAGYAFSRLRFPFREQLFVVCLSTMMLPGIVTMIPTYLLFRYLGWLNTFLPLIVPSFFGGGAFNIFLSRQFFSTIPLDYDEAARMDGANGWYIWLRIVLPLSTPVLATMTVFSVMYHWNDFMAPLLYLSSASTYTVAIGLNAYLNMRELGWQIMMAAGTVATLPIAVLYFLSQRYIVQGIVSTGLSGT